MDSTETILFLFGFYLIRILMIAGVLFVLVKVYKRYLKYPFKKK
ncbi:hypothetical protein ES708_07459 [subsurface metagenome]